MKKRRGVCQAQQAIASSGILMGKQTLSCTRGVLGVCISFETAEVFKVPNR